MDKVSVAFFVFFEEPFWIGVLERVADGKLSVCKVTFGAEPKDCEVYDFLLKNYHRLQLSPAVDTAAKKSIKNPKRVQREVRRQVRNIGIGSKSQQALKQQHEQVKQERRISAREEKDAEKQRRFELKQQKKKEKHRGR